MKHFKKETIKETQASGNEEYIYTPAKFVAQVKNGVQGIRVDVSVDIWQQSRGSTATVQSPPGHHHQRVSSEECRLLLSLQQHSAHVQSRHQEKKHPLPPASWNAETASERDFSSRRGYPGSVANELIHLTGVSSVEFEHDNWC